MLPDDGLFNDTYRDNVHYSLPTKKIVNHVIPGKATVEVTIRFQHNTLVTLTHRGERLLSGAAFMPQLHSRSGSFIISFPRAEGFVKRNLLKVLPSIGLHSGGTLCDQYEFIPIDGSWHSLTCDQKVQLRYEFGGGFPKINLCYKVLSFSDILVTFIRFVAKLKWIRKIFSMRNG